MEETQATGPAESEPIQLDGAQMLSELSGHGKPVSEQSTFEPVDIRMLEYVSEFDRHLACPICGCPFIDPVRLACDHTYCRLCYRQAISNQAFDIKSCPTCRRPVHEEALSIPRFLCHLIDDLLVRCPNAHLGCQTEVKRGEVQDHADCYCPFSLVPCPLQECRELVPRNRRLERCLHEVVSCSHCEISMPELHLQDHLSRACTKRSSPCHACGAFVFRCDLERHLKECPDIITTCTAVVLGCTFKGKRADVALHAAACPLVAVSPVIQSMNKRIDEQAIAMRSLQTKNDLLETSFDAIQDLLAVNPTNANQMLFTSPSSATAVSGSKVSQRDVDTTESPSFDPVTHHMLSLHESLREELERLSSALSEVDGRLNMTIINETLRMREDMSHTNAVISNLRMQLQWLTSARLQAESRKPAGSSAVTTIGDTSTSHGVDIVLGPPVRRLSDPSRQETKL